MEITKEIIRGGQLDMAITLGITIVSLIGLFFCLFKLESMEGSFFYFVLFVLAGVFFLVFAFQQERYYFEAEVTDYGVVQESGYRILSHKDDNLYILEKSE